MVVILTWLEAESRCWLMYRISTGSWSLPSLESYLNPGHDSSKTLKQRDIHRQTRGFWVSQCLVWNLTCPTSKCSFENSPKKTWEWSMPHAMKQVSLLKHGNGTCVFCVLMFRELLTKTRSGIGKSSSKYVPGRWYVSSQQSTSQLANT